MALATYTYNSRATTHLYQLNTGSTERTQQVQLGMAGECASKKIHDAVPHLENRADDIVVMRRSLLDGWLVTKRLWRPQSTVSNGPQWPFRVHEDS